jgi:heat shock protein HslJ
MRYFMVMVVSILALGMSQCKPAAEQGGGASQGDQHNSSNSLDWPGVYYGVTPCADCPGIQTIVWLNEDMTYRITTRYLERQKDSTEYSGTFRWNDAGNAIVLDSSGKQFFPGGFFVGENTLTVLDRDGNRMAGELAAHYVLTKDNYKLLGTDWVLVELNGKPVSVSDSSGRTPHMRFMEAESRFAGNGGCNGLSGVFELKGMNRITFSNMIRTQMACPALDIENEFIKALETTDNFVVAGDTLVLNRARMAPLARLRAAE